MHVNKSSVSNTRKKPSNKHSLNLGLSVLATCHLKTMVLTMFHKHPLAREYMAERKKAVHWKALVKRWAYTAKTN